MIDFSKLVKKENIKKRNPRDKIIAWGNRAGWPNPMTANVPKSWSSDDFEMYKQEYNKHSK